MKTVQAIQSSANVVRITSISAGDVYKRFDDSNDDRAYIGIVQAVHNDGEHTIIEALEYSNHYYSLDVNYKIMRGKNDYILFPATPEDLNLELDKARVRKVNEIKEAKEKIEKNEKIISDIDGLLSGETMKNLKAASYSEMNQAEYNRKLQELNG